MRFISLLLLTVLISCQSGSNSNAESKNSEPAQSTQTDTETSTSKMHPDHPDIPLAEKGITVVNPDGWPAQSMEFHIGYCMDMLANHPIESQVFCECFMTKIQYYYEPIYFKEAYEDQTIWNQECYRLAGGGDE